MSQNSHTLLLFFDKEDTYRNCLDMLRQLEAEAPDKAEVFSERLGVDIAQAWNNDWFNHSITPTPQFLRLDYDTSTGYELPLAELHQLFSSGLKAACLEVFYDQVGEFGQFYFMDDQLVEREDLSKKYPQIKTIALEQFECDSDDLDDDGCSRPNSIPELIKDSEKRQEDAKEMVDALIDLSKASRESGENPVDLLKGAMVLRALVKGLLHALGFGVITVLLFKGMWLWISIALILAVVLPLVYVMGVNAEFDDDDDDNLENGETAC